MKSPIKASILFAFIFSGLVTFSLAQPTLQIGAKGGVNFATLIGDTYSNLGPKLGIVLGLVAELPLNEKLSVQGEMIYSQEGARNPNYDFSSFSSVIYDQRLRYNYIQIPVVFKYHYTDKINLQALYQIGIRISANEFRKIKDGTPSFTDTSAGTRSFSKRIKPVYPSLGVGGEYKVNEKLNVQARFLFSIFDNVKKNAGDSEGTYPLILQIAAVYRLK